MRETHRFSGGVLGAPTRTVGRLLAHMCDIWFCVGIKHCTRPLHSAARGSPRQTDSSTSTLINMVAEQCFLKALETISPAEFSGAKGSPASLRIL